MKWSVQQHLHSNHTAAKLKDDIMEQSLVLIKQHVVAHRAELALLPNLQRAVKCSHRHMHTNASQSIPLSRQGFLLSSSCHGNTCMDSIG